MANKFSNNKKTKLIAGVIYDETPYIKASHSYLSQSDMEGKKFGRSYNVYIPDPGKVVDGIVADPDSITEVEVSVALENINTSVELDAWNKLTDIESFTDEVAKPKGSMLAGNLEQKVIEKTIFNAAQAMVVSAPSFKVLSDASAKLKNVHVTGKKVTFLDPEINGEIAESGLSKFIPSERMKEIYGESYLGQYAGSAVIDDPYMPIVLGVDGNGTLTLTEVVDADSNVIGYEPVKTATGIKKGNVYTVSGLKIVSKNGIFTNQDFKVIATEDGKMPEIRIAVKGTKFEGNPNAWVASKFTATSGVATVTATLALTAGTTYKVCQCRTEDAVGFDTYKFTDLPGSENETASFGNVSVKTSTYGDGKNMIALTRMDVPHACCLPDARNAVLMYVAQA